MALTLVGLSAVSLAFAWSSADPVRPSLVVEGSLTHHLGLSRAPGVYDRHSWTIRNDGRFPRKLRTHFTSGRSGFSLWLGRDRILNPGETCVVWLTWRTPTHQPSAFSGQAEVRTDDPDQPTIRFKVEGKTGLAD